MPGSSWHDHEMRGACIRSGFLLVVLTGASLAQAHRTVWEGVYTEAQAARGMAEYSRSCQGCHAVVPDGKAPLVGDAFWKSFSQKTGADLLTFVSTYMPNGAPGSLSSAAYEDIVAFILKSNGFPAGATEFGSKTIGGVQIVPKDGSTELPANALAHVVGCLVRSGADWVVTNATTPERAETAAPADQDATRPLGTRRIELKFVVTRLEPLAGSRVAVNGLLIGAGGIDGLNVTTVSRVSEKCP
jgi:S-disulfanyl-L-cysteine oxidoreductase SoxD